MSTEACSEFFLFSLDFELFAKNEKTLFLHTHFFTFLLITQDLNKFKTIPNILLERWIKFQQKILNSVVVGVGQSFQIFQKILNSVVVGVGQSLQIF